MGKIGKKQKASVIKIDPEVLNDSVIKMAAELMLSGGTVAFPTESFYGLGVDAKNEKALRRLFEIKRRNASQPVLILIPSVKSLQNYAKRIPPIAENLIKEFWPGGLTMVFEARGDVSTILTAGTGKIGIRISDHPVATGLANAIDGAVSGTSANVSGKPPCKSASEVLTSVGEYVDLILDGGETPGEIGSTILDVTMQPPRILREGIISKENLERFLKTVQDKD